MSRVSFVVLSALSLCIATPVFSQENISNQDFEERHAAAFSGVSAKLSIGYQYIDTGTDDNFVFPALPNSQDPANNIIFSFLRENEFQGGFVEGSIVFPLSETIGFQIDGLYSRQSSNLDRDLDVFGGGAHLFWRDPERGLFGLYGQFLEYGDLADSYQIGAEAQIYYDNLSLEFFAGFDNLEVTTQSTVISFIDFAQPGIGGFPPMVPTFRNVEATVDDDFFTAEAIAAFYPKDNLRISAGISHSFEQTSFLTGLEWKPSDKVASNLFIDGQIGEDIASVRVGFRFSFSENDKTLIRQYREDGVQNRLLNNSASLARCMDSFVINSFIDPSIPPLVAPRPISIPTVINFEPTTQLDGCDLRLNQ